MRQIALARQFAAALDACDYRQAAALLAAECRYERPGKATLVGPRAICASYEQSDARARRDFDAVAYSSSAAADSSGGIRLAFVDKLHRGDASHTFRCEQIVYFDGNLQIARIVLAEVPGQREQLSEFCAAHGARTDE